jgi:hypothetical protein
VRGRLERGEKRREAGRGAALGGQEAVAARASSGGWRWRMELAAGARLIERRRRGGQLRRREPKGKTYSREDATDARVRWAGRGGFGLPGQLGQRAGWAKGRVGRKVGRAESKEKEFLN